MAHFHIQLYKTFILCNYGEGQTEADRLPHFSVMNYTKFLFWIIRKSICSYRPYYYTYRPQYIIYYILWYYAVLYAMILCYIMDYTLFMRLYYMRYHVILYAILSNVVFNTTLRGFVYSYLAKVNIIYYQKIFKTFLNKRLTNKK